MTHRCLPCRPTFLLPALLLGAGVLQEHWLSSNGGDGTSLNI